MEAAFKYVLEKINRGMRIQGMYRQDVHELPVDSVREMNPSITQGELKERLQVSIVTVKRLMADLQKCGVIKRQGFSRKGKWIILGEKE